MNSSQGAANVPSVTDVTRALAGIAGGVIPGGGPKVSLSVHGGVPSERYDLEFVLGPDGRGVVDLTDELRERRVEEQAGEVSLDEVLTLFSGLDAQELVSAAQANLQIPPDSVVGELRLEIGGTTVVVPFMADQGQAETAGADLPPSVARVVAGLFEVSERITGMERIRPG